jgi:hypothetical protein
MPISICQFSGNDVGYRHLGVVDCKNKESEGRLITKKIVYPKNMTTNCISPLSIIHPSPIPNPQSLHHLLPLLPPLSLPLLPLLSQLMPLLTIATSLIAHRLCQPPLLV